LHQSRNSNTRKKFVRYRSAASVFLGAGEEERKFIGSALFIASFFTISWMTLLTRPAWAQDQVLMGRYQGNDAQVSHLSAIISLPHQSQTLEYEVCNADVKHSLYFYWDRANFGTGINHPIPFGSCAILSRAVDEYEEGSTGILFSLNNTTRPANAYVVKESEKLFTFSWSSILSPYFENDTPSV
jgi:hypothetical protein